MSNSGATNWLDIGDWGEGMNEYKLPATDELVSKDLKFYFSVGNRVIKYVFHDASSLRWEVLEGPERGHLGDEKYEAILVAPNIFFVDFVRKNPSNISVSMALDSNTRKATVIVATAPDRKSASHSFVDRLGKSLDLSTMKVEILHANVNPSSSDKPIVPHERTTDLIGKRVKYTYSSKHVYEHIYLNDRFFTWHCLAGVEEGLADTEICDYFKIAPDVYMFTWREKVMPTFGVVLINLKDMRSNGKTFGLDLTSGKLVNFTMGSRAEPINEINYW
jgi:hypothetical protein